MAIHTSRRAGESERQLRDVRDVAGILELSGAGLDLAYVEHWVSELGLEAVWGRARSAARHCSDE